MENNIKTEEMDHIFSFFGNHQINGSYISKKNEFFEIIEGIIVKNFFFFIANDHKVVSICHQSCNANLNTLNSENKHDGMHQIYYLI